MNLQKKQLRNLGVILIPPALILAAFLCVILMNKTIAPVDIYLTTPELYRPGNALKVHNHFISDIVQVYIPWKYYLSEYAPDECMVSVKSHLGTSQIKGFKLPQGDCYPFFGVRKYSAYDSFFLLRKFLSFFPAYDMSYCLSLIFIYLSFFFFFYVFYFEHRPPLYPEHRDLALITLTSALAVTSFPIARDLLFDGLSQGLPFLLISLGLLRLGFQSRTRLLIWASFLVLLVANCRTTLQGLGFSLLFWFAFVLIWMRKQALQIPKTVAMGLTLTAVLGIIYHLPAIHIFLLGTKAFLPQNEYPIQILLLKRAVASIFSFMNFIFGDLFVSFSTVDFTKFLEDLGAREYFSYDGNSYFINPLVSLMITLFIIKSSMTKTKQGKFLIKSLLMITAVDLTIIFLPTYKLFYFRFHSWWMMTNIMLIFLYLLKSKISPKFDPSLLRKVLIGCGIYLLVYALIVKFNEANIISSLAQRGQYGFETGYWPAKVRDLLKRLTFGDAYSILFFLTGWIGWITYKKQRYLALIAVATISGILLNIFFYNAPISKTPFYEYLAALKSPAPIENFGRSPFPENVNLLVNKPVYTLYESLYFDMKGGQK